MTRSLERLLRPRHIAVIGGHAAERVAEQLIRFGYSGPIWPVHPTRTHIAGLVAYRDVEALPAPPDACFVGVNRNATIAVINALADRGAGGAVCYASGFSESGDGIELQRQLVAAANTMPFLGPNCYGFINGFDRTLLWPDQHGATPLAATERGVAVIAQSSNIAINLSMQRRALPLGYLLTAGNQAQTGISTLACSVIEDPRVSVLGMYIEGIDDAAGFEALAERAHALGKPVVVLKVGRTTLAQAASITHTASLAGRDEASRAFFDRLGFATVHSLDVLLESCKLLHVHGALPGADIVSLSCSGGEAALMADAADGTSLNYRPFSGRARTRLGSVLGPIVTINNPLDYHTFIWAKQQPLVTMFETVSADGFDLAVLVMDFPRDDHCIDDEWWVSIDALITALRQHPGRWVILATLAENLPEHHAQRLMTHGLAVLTGLDAGIAAIDIAIRCGRFANRPAQPGPLTMSQWSLLPTRVLDEHAAKAYLISHGVPTVNGESADSLTCAKEVAARIGYPLAVKAIGVSHKTEQQAVELNVTNDAMFNQIASRLLHNHGRILIEPMLEDAIAEVLIGIQHTPPYGVLLTLASGGVLVELINDQRHLLLPTSREQIARTLLELRVARVLAGYRNKPAGDLDACIDAIYGVAQLATRQSQQLVELEINPLIVCQHGHGAWAADALIVMKEVAP